MPKEDYLVTIGLEVHCQLNTAQQDVLRLPGPITATSPIPSPAPSASVCPAPCRC